VAFKLSCIEFADSNQTRAYEVIQVAILISPVSLSRASNATESTVQSVRSRGLPSSNSLSVNSRPAKLRLGIQARFFWLQALVFSILTLALAGVLVYVLTNGIREDQSKRALLTAQMVAQTPTLLEAFDAPSPSLEVIQTLIGHMRIRSGVDVLGVDDANGKPLALSVLEGFRDRLPAVDNREPRSGWETVQFSKVGERTAVRGMVPVRNRWGEVVGVVSAGYILPSVPRLAFGVGLTLLPWFAVALAFALLSSIWLSRRIKSAMLNLEPHEIASLVVQHRGVLNTLQEGVLVVGQAGRVTMLNPRAAQLFGINLEAETQTDSELLVRDLWPDLHFGDVLRHESLKNLPLLLGSLPVLVNVSPMGAGEHLVTFRDRAESVQMAEELTQTKRYTDLLRAQTHEFKNRLHTLAGLIQLGRSEDALGIIRAQSRQIDEVRDLIAEIAVPRLAALLIGKFERARELGVTLNLEPGSGLSASWANHSEVIELIVGNLLENAFDAVLEPDLRSPGRVTLVIGEDPDGLQIEVQDNGHGIPESLRKNIFDLGVSSKGEGRGLGLGLVQQQVTALHGKLEHFRRDHITVFQVSLPSSAILRDQP
jgi:two-component system, CitB family, sensor kinase